MSGLESLVRVHQWILDEKRQRLAGLQQLLDRMEADLEVMEASLAKEREAASESLDGALAFQSFISAAVDRRDKLRLTISNLEQEIEVARDEVGEAFQDLKRYETAQDLQHRQELDQRRRREQLALDEMAVGLYRRNKAAGQKG